MFSAGIDPAHKNLLSQSLVLQTRDADEAASFLATPAVPYRSHLLSPASTISTQIFIDESRRMHLSRVKTNGALRVHARLPDDAYALILAVSGEVEHRVGGEMVSVRPGCAFVQSPLQAVEVKTPERFDLFFLKVEAAHLLHELESLLLRKVTAPLVFSPRFRLGTEAGLRFRRILLTLSAHLNRQSEHPGASKDATHPRRTVQELENDLITLLLEAQQHNYSRLLARHRDAGTWQLRAAEEYIRANAHLSLSLGDICMAAGVNSRTLQHSFQRKRSLSPMQFLRQLRLERVRAELLHPDPTTTVTAAASRWGFLHFGRFAAEYHARFGEKPSATLQRARLHC